MLEKKRKYNEAIHQLFIALKKAYDSIKMEVLHNIPIEFCIPIKLIRPVKMCLAESYRRIRIGKKSDMFLIRNCLK
jgi:hypothetical protein